ncbi:MAG: hypothetical protein K2M12_11060 [Muribaculaceae bacterium]|nr:hypothetical protein [Muribaculaceae bacterium]
MKMSRTRRVLATFLVVLFATYYCETTLFVHTHRFMWGDVTHSHPYAKAEHNHSQAECIFISALTNTIVTLTAAGVVLTPLYRLLRKLTVFYGFHLAETERRAAESRGPPALSF